MFPTVVLPLNLATGSERCFLSRDVSVRVPGVGCSTVRRRRLAHHTHSDDLAVFAKQRGNVVLHHWREYICICVSSIVFFCLFVCVLGFANRSSS